MNGLGCLGGRVSGLERLFLDPERLDPGLQALTGRGQLLLLAGQDEKLFAQPGELFLDCGLAQVRFPDQVRLTSLQRALALAGELPGLLLQRG